MADALTLPPPRPRLLSRDALVSLAVLVALAAWPLAASALGETWYVNLASRAAILALAGVGLNLALGYGGMVSLGHAAFFGLGGYVVGISADAALAGTPLLTWPIHIEATTHLPTLWAVSLGVAALAALAIGAISLRTSGVYFIMITLAFAQMLYYFALSWPAYGGEDGLPIYVRNAFPGLDTYDPLHFFALCFAALVLALALSALTIASRFGQALQCARASETRLATLGIEPFPIRLTAFVLSGAITGLAGALYAELNGFVSPTMLGWHTSGEIIVFVLLGGVARLIGPVAGAVAFVLLETLLGGLTEHWQLGLGLVLLGVVLFQRGGLIGLIAGPRHG
ncbi:MAG: branched-chain amino acid ABC transporter permease [Pseudomonadota bacterium]